MQGQLTCCAASNRVPQLLRSALWNTGEPAILTSGTLAAAGNFDHTEQLLGLAAYKPLRHFSADSPFNYKKKCLLWLAQKHRMGSAWQTCMDGKWESYRESLQKLRGKNFIVINDFGWPISPDHYGKIVDRVAEKAGIRKIHPHMFRHTFVSILTSALPR